MPACSPPGIGTSTELSADFRVVRRPYHATHQALRRAPKVSRGSKANAGTGMRTIPLLWETGWAITAPLRAIREPLPYSRPTSRPPVIADATPRYWACCHCHRSGQVLCDSEVALCNVCSASGNNLSRDRGDPPLTPRTVSPQRGTFLGTWSMANGNLPHSPHCKIALRLRTRPRLRIPIVALSGEISVGFSVIVRRPARHSGAMLWACQREQRCLDIPGTEDDPE